MKNKLWPSKPDCFTHFKGQKKCIGCQFAKDCYETQKERQEILSFPSVKGLITFSKKAKADV
jgi:predicted RecB family nuclease